jgi:hypothetical protein
MLLFLDTEFTDLAIDPRLISIGLVTEDGAHQFYAELTDTYTHAQCAPFVQEAVLPHLDGKNALTFDKLSLQLGNWIEAIGQPVQFATDSIAWDWMWVEELFATPGTWPENADHKPMHLYNLIDAQAFEQAEERARFADPTLRRHHALDDAIANRRAYLTWTTANKDSLNALAASKKLHLRT